jgi:hypothetical protein
MSDILGIGLADPTYDNTANKDWFRCQKFKALKTVKIHTITIQSSLSAHVKVAIYADNSGSPGALLRANNSSTPIASGSTDIPMSELLIIKDTYYWLAFNHDTNTSIRRVTTTGGSHRYKAGTFSTFSFPDPAGTGFTEQTDRTVLIAGYGLELSFGGTWGG